MIPKEWHKEYAFNCLTDEQFEKFSQSHDIGDTFDCDCDECGEYTLDDSHRCNCGNRRCYFTYIERFGFSLDVD